MLIQSKQTFILLLNTYASVTSAHSIFRCPPAFWRARGGGDANPQSTITVPEKEIVDDALSLDEKVQNAMEKLGLVDDDKRKQECDGGKCELQSVESSKTSSLHEATKKSVTQECPHAMAERICREMNVTKELAMAALGATAVDDAQSETERKLDENAARTLIQQELNLISSISEDREDVQKLVTEGHDIFLARRALAFAEESMDDARAILEADQNDAAEEERFQEEVKSISKEEISIVSDKLELQENDLSKLSPVETVDEDADLDPSSTGDLPSVGYKQDSSKSTESLPPPAKRSDVVFEATSAQIQELVLESPVPVLLDAYAPWCGPCKALTPALEEFAIKSGGSFRLVKVNTDNERAISAALEITALPTVFAIRDGKLLNNFQGMPQSEEMMKNFMMGLLMPEANFNPPVTPEQKKRFLELSLKLAKTAGSASFSFSEREKLQNRVAKHLDDLIEAYNGDIVGAEDSAKVVRSLLSNIIRDPYNVKYRKVNLENKKIAAAIRAYAPCIAILKNAGFIMEEENSLMVIGKSKNVVNVSALSVARRCIDKWIDMNQKKIAAANRKRKDEAARLSFATEAANGGDVRNESQEEYVDPNAVMLKIRFEGKKKVHEVEMRADDPLRKIFESLFDVNAEKSFQIICASKKLIVKSDDDDVLSKSLQSLGLTPAASLVIKVDSIKKQESTTNSLKERVSTQKTLKRGSHTMQSIGIYAKDDNARGEVIDGGGGVLYEQDVTDDEEEENIEDDNQAKD